MVNSPSRPNLRPPAPMECGGMTSLWNWETCLPVNRATLPARGGDGPVPTFLSVGQMSIRQNQAQNPGNQTKSNQIKPPPPFASFAVTYPDLRNPRPLKVAVRKDQGKKTCNRASSRQIKAHQGIRQKKPRPLELPHSLEVGIWNFLTRPLCDFATPRLCVKTPAIKANRA